MNGARRRRGVATTAAGRLRLVTLGAALVVWGVAPAAAQTAKVRYESALARESDVRVLLARGAELSAPERTGALAQVTRLVAAYEAIPRRFPTSGYADNALWQAAGVLDAAYRAFARADDRSRAIRLYSWLIREYPTSPLVRRARSQISALDALQSVEATLPPSGPAAPDPGSGLAVPVIGAPTAARAPAIGAGPVVLKHIQRTVLPESVRVTVELDREVPYHEERISGPDRVFFDLKGAELAPGLMDRTLTFTDDIVRQIRTGRHPDSTVRVVLDLAGVARYSVFTLYNPFRLVIDCERPVSATVAASGPAALPASAPAAHSPVSDAAAPPAPSVRPPAPDAAGAPISPVRSPVESSGSERAEPPPAVAPPPILPSAPTVPSSNAAGGFSLARQLGLGVSRIVIDPGHGGHDPGAMVPGLREADLTLDVALRLEKLLQKEPGVEVVLTRRSDVYVPLEERTAIANREDADLFLSIHANASRNTAARGVETYFLSFASSPDAEAVAARENSSSGSAMRNLPDIIKAIALNTKLDESRDLAATVQEALVTRLRRSNQQLRNLGVKKAPFVVLIGANMPSVLAEMAFLTNRQEAQLLKTVAYKQRIAEALLEAVLKYRQSLKRQVTVAEREP
jgi:N-acetylmuramoyl-L-alanine amidase